METSMQVSMFTYLLLGIIAFLLIACLVLLFTVFRLLRRLKTIPGGTPSGTGSEEAVVVCRSCTRLYPIREKRCPHCGAERN